MLKKFILPLALVLSTWTLLSLVNVLGAAGPNFQEVSTTGAHFTPKLMLNDKPATTDSKFIASDKINLSVEMKVDAADVDQDGSIYVVLVWNNVLFMKDENGNLLPWDGNFNNLVAYTTKTLPETAFIVEMISGLGGMTGNFAVYFGYQKAQSGTLIYGGTPVTFTVQSIQQVMSTSLHGTTRGMGHYYSADQGGFEQFTHIPYEDPNLTCTSCHVEQTACTTCHEIPGDKPENDKCFDCHGRQKLEQMSNPDIHLTAKADGGLGMRCADCHSAKQVHGDGNEYVSVNDPEHKNKVDCQQSDCHTDITIAGQTMHETHNEDLDCAACHVKSTTTCYSCHFEDGSAFQPPITDWKILVKRKSTGKVTTGNIQTMAAGGNTLLVVAPYFGHTVQIDGSPTCESCHNSDAVSEYKDHGTITLATWHEADKTLSNIKGVVPIPLDWETALQMPFIAKDEDEQWTFVKDEADATQMLFADPIDVDSMPRY